MSVRLTKHHPYTITLDGEPIRLLFKRMTVEEAEIFKAQFEAYNADRGKPTEVMISPTEIAPDFRAWLEANATWLRETFEAYVTVVPGDLEMDGVPVLDGRALFDALGLFQALRAEILANLYLVQVVTEEQKKTLLLQLASAIGSPIAPPPTANGDRPAPTAVAVETLASAPSAPAIDQDAASSGTTALLSSEPALSAS